MVEVALDDPPGFASQDPHMCNVFPRNCMAFRNSLGWGSALLTSLRKGPVDYCMLLIESNAFVRLPKPQCICYTSHKAAGVIPFWARPLGHSHNWG